ncbi:MAG: hypothetical protein HY913_19435 [Desulfomonile tiedjei]|nr:hypothetical protein [Desulfomonile tiedjei]
MNEAVQDCSAELRDLKRRANQMASMHSMEAEWYHRWDVGLDVGALVSSVFLLSLSVVCEDFLHRTVGMSADNFKWMLAFWAALTLSITVTRLAWHPAHVSARHREAVQRYSRIRHQIATTLEGNEPVSLETFCSLQEAYLDSADLPTIRNRKFARLKQAHLRKVAYSKCLDNNPHESLRSIKKRLSREASNKFHEAEKERNLGNGP